MQSFTAISLYAGILLERPAEFYCYFLNKCGAEHIEGQSFTAISLYSGILIKRPLNKGTAEQTFTVISQRFTAISLYAGILLERALNKGTAEQIEGYVASVFKAEFYCYFAVCGNTAGKACRILLLFRYMREYCFKGLFEIPPHKAFPHFPFNTRV
ncbi:hypothetical protein P7K49_039760 [Saguinus oedipus]|uniref:Uncharacterized protein n=1 Tax=Saguinus oedipus TaxID=9490 RepID=A0ABQ9TA66_SAGOE|nr:hypothetical protein P7K49_039760 [Saguinus oedipus]